MYHYYTVFGVKLAQIQCHLFGILLLRRKFDNFMRIKLNRRNVYLVWHGFGEQERARVKWGNGAIKAPRKAP